MTTLTISSSALYNSPAIGLLFTIHYKSAIIMNTQYGSALPLSAASKPSSVVKVYDASKKTVRTAINKNQLTNKLKRHESLQQPFYYLTKYENKPVARLVIPKSASAAEEVLETWK